MQSAHVRPQPTTQVTMRPEPNLEAYKNPKSKRLEIVPGTVACPAKVSDKDCPGKGDPSKCRYFDPLTQKCYNIESVSGGRGVRAGLPIGDAHRPP